MRKLSALFTAVAVAVTLFLVHGAAGSAGQARTPQLDTVAALPPAIVTVPHAPRAARQAPDRLILAAATSTPRRWVAMRFAQSKVGGWYLYGGNGPTRYDCSGLTSAAYHHAGISLPRTAADQRSSGKTTTVSAAHVHWGDLVFWGYGHVELFGHWRGKVGGSFYSLGAHHSGTRIGYRLNSNSGVHFEHVVGAG
jgi:peptidoglycan DL-endopeptidase CwlO